METLERLLNDLGEAPGAAERVDRAPLPPLPSALPVAELAADSVGAAALLASLIVEARSGGARRVRIDGRRVAAAYASERLFSVGGVSPAVWAELSGFFPTRDGWLRTHGNYPHHAERLLAALHLPVGTRREGLRERLAQLEAREAAARVVAAGGVAATVERFDAADEERRMQHPLVERSSSAGARRGWLAGELPLAGIRVLDLTRVIAGPVATRTLALFGADVLRVDAARLPEIAWQHLDSGAGKRTTLLELGEGGDRSRFTDLLAEADVVVLGYRPSSWEHLALTPKAMIAAHPGLVVAALSAWGFDEPDAGRRGFDSIVQAASGISWIESADDRAPGALPVQALDHSAGYLLAAAIMSAVRRQRSEGGSHIVSVSLRRVASQLLGVPAGVPVTADAHLADQTVVHAGVAGVLRYVAPAPAYAGSPADFAHPPRPWGSDIAEWLPRC